MQVFSYRMFALSAVPRALMNQQLLFMNYPVGYPNKQ